MNVSNQEVAKLLRSVATALTLKKANQFQVRAYQTAADTVEHSTTEIKDLWQEHRLDEIPGLGENLQSHLDEFFKTGRVKHFDQLKANLPEVIFELIEIPGVGPQNASELAKLGVKSRGDLEKKIKNGELVKKGFSSKIAQKLALSLVEFKARTGRMLLPYAGVQADKILAYLKQDPAVKEAYPLGSFRRKVATIGDLDFAVSSTNPKQVIDHFTKMPAVSRVLEQGDNQASVVLGSGLQIDLLVGQPESFGALLQHFTGSKSHNIKLRTLALSKGYSLSEYGVKKVKTGRIEATKTENELYSMLGMQTPAPEIREDDGEIEAAIAHKLPQLIEEKDIKGDLHLHSNFPLEPSHGPGANSLGEIVDKASQLGYQYVGISDHSPGFTTHSKEQIIKLIQARNKAIEQIKSSIKKIRVLNGLEIDIMPNGVLSVPNEGLEILDYCIAGIHSSHRLPKDKMTERILKALQNPFVDILAHPTGRLLNERESYEADWAKIFKYCAKNHKVLEINSYPNRMDLRDDLVREALNYGVNFVINTDAHEVSQMENMSYGVAVARQGWVTKHSVVNSWEWKKFAEWFKIRL